MLNYYGTELLNRLLLYYIPRCQMATERGYSDPSSKYFWLYEELTVRIDQLKQTMLFLKALPAFMKDAEPVKAMDYAFSYVSKFFSKENIGEVDPVRSEKHPYFNDDNAYNVALNEAFENFAGNYDMDNLPMLYVDLAEYTVRGIRLYFHIRELRIHAIDRDKFDEIMAAPPPASS